MSYVDISVCQYEACVLLHHKQEDVEEFCFQGDPSPIEFLIRSGIISKVCAGQCVSFIH